MGFFLAKTWPWWLLAALLAALVAWLLCRWWAGRRGDVDVSASAVGTGVVGDVDAETAVRRLTAEREEHFAELATLRSKALVHDDLQAQVASMSSRLSDYEGDAGSVAVLQARLRELELDSVELGDVKGRLAGLEGEDGVIPGLHARIAELEGQAAAVPEPDLVAGGRLLGFSVSMDDLTVVEGIGPKIAGLCNEAGIHSWRQLAQTPVSRLQEILAAAGPRYQVHDPSTWPRQAALLADGHWEPFKLWTDQLKGGRPAE